MIFPEKRGISRRSFTSYCSTGTLCLGMYEKTANVFGGLLSFSGENENEDSLFWAAACWRRILAVYWHEKTASRVWDVWGFWLSFGSGCYMMLEKGVLEQKILFWSTFYLQQQWLSIILNFGLYRNFHHFKMRWFGEKFSMLLLSLTPDSMLLNLINSCFTKRDWN